MMVYIYVGPRDIYVNLQRENVVTDYSLHGGLLVHVWSQWSIPHPEISCVGYNLIGTAT